MIKNNHPEKYMTTIKHRITKIFWCEYLAFITHLYSEYGTITSPNLTKHSNRMTDHCNQPIPIFELLQQLTYGKDFTAEGNRTIKESQLIRLSENNVHLPGIFN